MKTCIKSCGGAAASARNMLWKSPPINSPENVTIRTGSLWILSVIGITKNIILTWYTRLFLWTTNFFFSWSSSTLITSFFIINFLWNYSCSISFLTYWKNTSIFFEDFRLKRNSYCMVAKSISIAHLGQLESHLISPFLSILKYYEVSYLEESLTAQNSCFQ